MRQQAQNAFISNKLLFEAQPGKFLSIGFGDVACSDLDVVCVSAFAGGSHFAPNSAIGSLADRIGYSRLQSLWPQQAAPGDAHLIRLSSEDPLAFQNLIVVFSGYYKTFKSQKRDVSNDVQLGLQKTLNLLKELKVASIDVTALGTQYGGIERRHSFDLISEWVFAIFSSIPNISLIRLVSNDTDTFVDFFESLYRMKQSVRMIFQVSVNPQDYLQFESDIQGVLQILDYNPNQVIIMCRNIIEKIIRQLCQRHAKKTSTLAEGVCFLHQRKLIPSHIYSYLDTCRVLGNFANHDISFSPCRRDAESVMFITLTLIAR